MGGHGEAPLGNTGYAGGIFPRKGTPMVNSHYTIDFVDAEKFNTANIHYRGEKKLAIIEFDNPIVRSHVAIFVSKDLAFEGRSYGYTHHNGLIIGSCDGMETTDFYALVRDRIRSYPEAPRLPYNIFVKLEINTSEIDEPNMGSVQFYSDEPTEEKFRQKVRDAVKEWIETYPDDYLASEHDTGTASLDNADPSDKDFNERALETGATWDMVYSDLPDVIALKHGFFAMPFHTTFDESEYGKI